MDTESVIRAEQEAAPQAQPQKPAKITFDQTQQEKVNELIREAQGRAARDLRAELETTKAAAAAKDAELQLWKSAANPELAAAREQLAVEQTARSAAELRESNARRNAALHSALEAEGVLGISDAVRLLSDSVKWSGDVLVGSDGKPLADIIRDFVNSRPWAVRSAVRPGTGSVEASRSLGNEAQLKPEQIFGRGSDARLANNLAMSKPREYQRLKSLARERGLVA